MTDRHRAPIDMIVLERTPCYGTCPAYILTLTPTGMTWEGTAFVDPLGRHTATPKPKVFDALALRAERIGLDTWIPRQPDRFITCSPSIYLSVERGRHVRRIELTDWSLPGLSGFVKRLDGLAALAGWGPERGSGQ